MCSRDSHTSIHKKRMRADQGVNGVFRKEKRTGGRAAACELDRSLVGAARCMVSERQMEVAWVGVWKDSLEGQRRQR